MSERIMKTHGSGEFSLDQFRRIGENVVFEPGVLVFHPENIELGSHIYIGHYSILKGYYNNQMVIGDGTWIGQGCFFHSAGGLTIGKNVGIGPGVKILTSSHSLEEHDLPILRSPIRFASVLVRDNCDIGTGSIILPGVQIGQGVQVGAGSVVTDNIEDYAIVAGVPARLIRYR
jgi:acetyltransferase-like isoleucine patch superfamily enzyme